MVVVWGVLVAIFVSIEIMMNQWLMIRRQINGDISGTFFMLTEGIIGTVCLIITSIAGSGIHEMTGESFGMIILAACFAFSGIVIANFACSIGIAGIVLSIFNANAAIHVVMSAVFLNQKMSQM